MSEENTKIEITKESGCAIQCECFKKFLIVAAGTFVGVYLALSLHGFVNKPVMPNCPFQPPVIKQEFQIPYGYQFDNHRPDHFQHKFRHHSPKRHHHFQQAQTPDKNNIKLNKKRVSV